MKKISTICVALTALLVFVAKGSAQSDGLKIRYTFDDATGNVVPNAAPGATDNGTIYNEASVVSMGKYNVLSLGTGSGYFDMGQSAGSIFPTLGDYTVSVYYKVNNSASLSGDGYFLWEFSTSNACSQWSGVYSSYRLNAQRFALSTGGWNSEYAIEKGGAADKGSWHNVVYRQTGNDGELYLDGYLVGTSDVIPTPGSAFISPPLYNWIGRSQFAGDNYLHSALVYDFRLYDLAVPDIQISDWASLISDLDNELFAASVVELDNLLDEAETLLADYNSNMYPLGAMMALDAAYTNVDAAYGTLTATNIESYIDILRTAIESYKASALGLKIQYTFDNVNNNIVTNMAPGATDFNGTIYNNASVIPMGKYNVLSLGAGSGYLDIGQSAGYLFPTIENFTVSAYYRVDKNASLDGAGYFLWAFSVLAANSGADGPYVAYRLNAQRFALSTGGWGNEKGMELGMPADKDGWHNVVYRQTGNTGELFIDGYLVESSDDIPVPGSAFTTPPLYNWIGKAPFSGDSYLKNTLVYDFEFYNQAVPDLQINNWAAVAPELDNAYNYGSAGDFTQLAALIAKYNAFLPTVQTGAEIGQYSEAAILDFQDAIAVAQALVTENKVSQFLIDDEVAILTAAYDTFLGSVGSLVVYPVSEGPAQYNFESGLYYIQVGDYYLTVPEDGVNNSYLQLQPYINNDEMEHNNQVWNIQYNYGYSNISLDPPQALFSFVSDAGVWDDDGAWHLDEIGRMKTGDTPTAQSADNVNWSWREHRIYFNGSTYCIANQENGEGTLSSYLIFNETEGATATTSATTKKFNFVFRTIEDVVANPAIPPVTAVQPLKAAGKAIIYGAQGEIVVSGACAGDGIRVCDISGRLIKTLKASGVESRINIVSGLYIVRIMGQTPTVNKVIVR